MAASKTIGGINVTISATIDKFAKTMTTARRLLANFNSSIKNTVFSLKGLAVAMTGGLTAGLFVKFTTDQFEAIDALKDLSDKLGISTEKLAGLQLAASEVGVSNELLERSLTTLNKKMGMVGDQALRAWIEKTSKLTTHQQKLAAATEMFGMRGASMVRFLQGGTKALDEAQQAAVNLGLAIDRKTAVGVDRAIEAFARFKMAVSGIFRTLAAQIAPFVEVLSNKMTSFLAEGGRGKNIGGAIADAIIRMAAFVSDTIAKMAAGVMDAMAAVARIPNQIAGTKVGQSLGLNFSSKLASVYEELTVGAHSIRKNLPGAAIESAIAEARKAAAQAVKDEGGGGVGRLGSRLFGGLMSDATKGNLKQGGGLLFDMLGKGLMGAQRGIIEGRAGLSTMIANAIANSKGAGSSNSLTFAESGSADSFRQRAAIRKANEMQQIAKDQKKILQDILKAIMGGGTLPAANL